MDLKEKMLEGLNQMEVLQLSDSQLQQRIETTISKTFMWMGITLFVAFAVAYYLYIKQIAISAPIFWASAIGGFVLVVVISFGRTKLNYSTLAFLLVVFGVLEGVGLTGVFKQYALGSVYNVFLTTSIMFGLMAFAGYTLKSDMTKLGNILFFGLIAIILGSFINMFWANAEFNIWLNIIGVAIFCGFIVYDMSMLKQMALLNDDRVEILMGLTLYLDFINIFLMLLQLLGSRND